MHLGTSHLPLGFHVVDKSSWRAQKEMLWTTGVRLSLLSAAALFGGLTWKVGAQPVDLAGLAVAGCFVLAIAIELFGMRRRPERNWYEGRAAAESLKTLAWRYAIGGDPFPVSLGATDAEELMVKRVDDVMNALSHLTLDVPVNRNEQVSPEMRAIRAAPLEERRKVYLRDRIIDQEEWYTTKSKGHRRSGTIWALVLLTIEAAGLLGAILKAANLAPIDILGFAGALAAGATAWLQMKQHDNLGTAYALAASELSSVRSRLTHVTDEASWSRFVDESEEAISREHTMWKASRGVSTP